MVADGNLHSFAEAPRVTRLPATKCLLQLSLLYRPVSLVAKSLPKVEDDMPEVEDLSRKRPRPSNAICFVASIYQHISIIDHISIICNFVERMDVNVQFAEKKAEIRGYLQAKLESLQLNEYISCPCGKVVKSC